MRHGDCRTVSDRPRVSAPTMPPHMPTQCTDPKRPNRNADSNVSSVCMRNYYLRCNGGAVTDVIELNRPV